MENLLGIVVFLVFVGLVYLPIWHIRRTNRTLRANFETLAAKYGLQLSFHKAGLMRQPWATGVFEGREMRILTLMRTRKVGGVGRPAQNLHAYTQVMVDRVRPGGPAFEIRPNAVFHRKQGETSIATGDPGFDDWAIVVGPDPEAILRLLDVPTRAKLFQCVAQGMSSKVTGDDKRMSYEEDVVVTTKEKFARFELLVDLLVDLSSR
jgi:hypothetical protein